MEGDGHNGHRPRPNAPLRPFLSASLGWKCSSNTSKIANATNGNKNGNYQRKATIFIEPTAFYVPLIPGGNTLHCHGVPTTITEMSVIGAEHFLELLFRGLINENGDGAWFSLLISSILIGKRIVSGMHGPPNYDPNDTVFGGNGSSFWSTTEPADYMDQMTFRFINRQWLSYCRPQWVPSR